MHVREGHVVMLGSPSCSCGKWDKSGIPCHHAIAAIAFEGGNLYAYVADWFKKETYLIAYQFPVNPLRGRKFWRVSEEDPMKSPMVKRMPGRPAVKRRREPLEGKSIGKSRLSREGRVMRCRICHVQGHNRLRCPQRYNIDTHGSPQAEPSQAGHAASSRIKKKRTEAVNTDGVASRNTASHQVDAPPPTSHTAASSIATSHQVDAHPSTNATNLGGKKKRKTNVAWSSDCSGAQTGEAIVGRVVSQHTPFITARELDDILNKRREARMKAQREELSEQPSAAMECPEMLTQQSRVDTADETNSAQFK